MRPPRFRIRTMMVVVTVTAISLAAIRNPTKSSATAVFHTVFALLMIGSYKAKRASGSTGLAWTGFAAFGWAHLVFGMVTDSGYHGVPHVLTEAAMPHVLDAFERQRVVIGPDARIAMIWTVRSLLSLLAGLVGAVVFALVAATEGRLSNDVVAGRDHSGRASASPQRQEERC